MDEDEVGEDQEEAEDECISARWSWPIFIVRVLETVSAVFYALHTGLQSIADLFGRHHNWKYDQQEFAEGARQEIEMISERPGEPG